MVLPTAFAEAAARAEPLARHTSLRVGGAAEVLLAPESEAEAAAVLRHCHRHGIPLHVLGGGCNLLVDDGPIPGVVLATRRLRGLVVADDHVVAAAGHPFPDLVRRAPELGIPALPGCPGIPGSVGGVVAMNAGGRHGSVGEALVAVRGLDRRGRPFERRVREGDLAYRWTLFRDHVVTAAVFRREPGREAAPARALLRRALAEKQRRQPLSAWSAGCIFKNPGGPTAGPSAGALIEAAGLKGRRRGGAQVSPVHANFIVTTEGGTAADVHALIGEIREAVARHAGTRLELEVCTWRADDGG